MQRLVHNPVCKIRIMCMQNLYTHKMAVAEKRLTTYIVCISTAICPIEMGFGSKCSNLNGHKLILLACVVNYCATILTHMVLTQLKFRNYHWRISLRKHKSARHLGGDSRHCVSRSRHIYCIDELR